VIGVVLVGGFGTRLRPLTNHTPKAMLPVANRPFLEHQLEHLASHGVDRVILACGYRPDALRAHFGDRVEYVVEDEPLGTAGAIAHAARGVEETFVACNGDVLTDLDISALVALHRERGARLTLALHPVDDPSRYGVVETAADGAVTRFVEKPPPGSAAADTINAGTYVVEPEVLAGVPAGRAVSIEQEVFPTLIGRGLYAQVQAGRWIDIGTPESYRSANVQLAPPEGLVDPTASIQPGARIVRSVVGPGARVGVGASVCDSVLLPGAVVPEGGIVENRVIDGSEPVW
jgi:NDP-sugar pyrophosphorylase family protein